jgi:hypothetical protein
VGHPHDLGDLKTIISASLQSTTKKESMIKVHKKCFILDGGNHYKVYKKQKKKIKN